jgi:hypothetical protein
VCERIAVEMNELFARLKFNALELLRAQLRSAYFDPAKLFDAAREPVPLDQLDEETRGALTVTYARRRSGDHVTHVRQTPRHVALAMLQKRLDAFEKVQRELLAPGREQAEAGAGAGPSIFDIELRLDAAQGASVPSVPSVPSAQVEALPVASTPSAEVAAPVEVAPVVALAPEAVKGEAGAPASTLTRQQQAEVAAAAADPEAPPSPYEPGYDFKKDPNAGYGGRFTAWNRYWKERRAREQAAAEEAAALRNPPANMRIGPGKTVPVRMEPGYNPPWLRNNRPEFAIGAGECWLD